MEHKDASSRERVWFAIERARLYSYKNGYPGVSVGIRGEIGEAVPGDGVGGVCVYRMGLYRTFQSYLIVFLVISLFDRLCQCIKSSVAGGVL